MNSPRPDNTIELARQSTRWSQADSAGGYTMRYITAMRDYLIELWGDGEAVDKSLVLLLNHLSSKGFGGSDKGRLRDYLLRSTRSAAAAHHKREESSSAPPVDKMSVEDPAWIRSWRECLLGRVWRALERFEHAHPGNMEFRVLRAVTDNPGDDSKLLALRVSKTQKNPVSPQEIKEAVKSGRVRFAQLLADEVADTLESPSKEDVETELTEIGLINLVKPFAGPSE